MSGAPDVAKLNTVQWGRLQELADRFHQARKQGDSLNLESILPPPDSPLRQVALHELIIIDMEVRWEQGRGVGLDYYLEKYSELGSARALRPALILEEYHIRHRHGDKPPLSSYQKRFPDQFEELRRLVESHLSSGVPSVAPPKAVDREAPADQDF